MQLTAEDLINKHFNNRYKVVRTFSIYEDIVYYVYQNRRGETYTVLISLTDWESVKEFPITVSLTGPKNASYLQASILYEKERYVLARFILGAPEDLDVDHIDWNSLNNLRSNIRLCTSSENAQNRRVSKNNTSGITGVSWSNSQFKWVVNVSQNCERISLGAFEDLALAADTLKAYKIKHMPFTPEARGES